MSADNWRVCPRHQVIDTEARNKFAAAVAAAYGQVPIAEFDVMRAQLNEWTPLPETFREDWEIGVEGNGDEAVLYISYVGSCQGAGDSPSCGLRIAFKHEQGMLEP